MRARPGLRFLSRLLVILAAAPGVTVGAQGRGALDRPVAACDPRWELRRGERCFRIDGKPSFLLGRNPTERTVEAFARDFDSMAAHGETLVRLHLMHGIPPNGRAGQIDEAWAAQWDRVFDAAASRKIAVIPVFSIWAQWNDGSSHELWHVWNDNPYNAARGGPAQSPSELLGDTECRRLWLRWLSALVKRWHKRPNIVAWEPFSELDLLTGCTPRAAADFVASAARAVRSADRRRRPVTVSLSGVVDWPEVFGSPAVDIVQAHPYAEHPRYAGRLCDMLLDTVRDRLRRYGKPVLLGECGLDARPPANTLTLADRAYVGIRQAIWASAVSGALSGRMLWWEDGYDKYERADISRLYRDAAAPVARFVRRISYDSLQPTEAKPSPQVRGGALSGGRMVVGWFRDARCDPRLWPAAEVAGASVEVSVPVRARVWRVEFFDTQTGLSAGVSVVAASMGVMRIPLPAFRESIALIARPIARPPGSS